MTAACLTAGIGLLLMEPVVATSGWAWIVGVPPLVMIALLLAGPPLARRRWVRIDADGSGVTLTWPWPWRRRRWRWSEVHIDPDPDGIRLIACGRAYPIRIPTRQGPASHEVLAWLWTAQDRQRGHRLPDPDPPTALQTLRALAGRG